MRKLKTFGQWLHERRRAQGMSQEQLAKAAKCSKSYVSTLERGAIHSSSGGTLQPSKDMVDALARALGVEVNEARLMAGYAPLTGKIEPFDYDLDRLEQLIPPSKRPVFRRAIRQQAESLAEALSG